MSVPCRAGVAQRRNMACFRTIKHGCRTTRTNNSSQRIVNLSRITLSVNCFLSSTDSHIIINLLFIGNKLISDIARGKDLLVNFDQL